MLSISDKLKFIAEGYSIEEINENPNKFNTIKLEVSYPSDELCIMIESVNADLTFINETHSIMLQESALETFKEKIKRFIAWVIEKIMNIINWIKSKFFSRTKKTTDLSRIVDKKARSGELDGVIRAIKDGDENEYINVKKKHGSPIPGEKIKIDINNFRGTVVDADKFDNFIQNNLTVSIPRDGILPKKEALKVTVRENIINSSVPDMKSISDNIIKIIYASLKNVENFRSSLIRGISNSKLNSEDIAENTLLNLASGNKVNSVKELKTYILGNPKEVELSSDMVSKINALVDKITKEGDVLFKAYNDIKDMMNKWKEESVKIIDKYKDSAEIKHETLTNRIDQMMRLFTGAVSALNVLLSLHTEALNECQFILVKLNSL